MFARPRGGRGAIKAGVSWHRPRAATRFGLRRCHAGARRAARAHPGQVCQKRRQPCPGAARGGTRKGVNRGAMGWHGPWLSGHGPRTQTCRKPHGHLPMRLLLRAGRRHGRARLAPLRAARGSAADGRRRLRRGRGRVRHSMAAQPSAGLTPQPWLRRFAPRTGTPTWMRRQFRRLAPTAPAIGGERVRDRPDPGSIPSDCRVSVFLVRVYPAFA